MVDMFATKLNHQLRIYVSPVPDANAMYIDALNISWGGSGRLCLLSCSAHTKGHRENEHLQVQNDSSSTRVAQDALVFVI